MFKYQGGRVVNEKGKCVEVSGGYDHENRNVVVWNRHNGKNQQWKLIYVDHMKPEPKKGQLNTEFGLYVERPFHIVTALSSKRYLDMIGSNLVLKTPNGRKTQVFWFDQRSKTIKSQHHRSWSFDIQNSGRGSNMRMTSTNSAWW